MRQEIRFLLGSEPRVLRALDPTLTVLDALAEAGGSSGEIDLGTGGGAADASQVRLVRRSGELRILNLRPDQITEEVRALKIQSGDWIDNFLAGC